ncbi:helix-turn-helix domain-containing protein [Labedella phragmitis]|uniref:Helix-turn-helix domain-containing protein n=1 Tax=Labedella phragmitis TaxID=2498849 RepID=A0A3S3Z6F9_9MICO|nr:helix-turn-helix domain-containing protein [Labedella phragmitis]RWZ52866.1 helix-turn-helix domain-containing protein [Labedella phragmitis]
MSDLIRTTREQKGVRARDLAKRLGVTAGAISQMEESERSETIKLHTLRRALDALDAAPVLTTRDLLWTERVTPAAVARAVARELEAGREGVAFRLVTDGVRQLRSNQTAFSREQLTERPPRLPSKLWDTFFAALYAHALGAEAPAWARPRALAEPTYLFPQPSLQRRADESTPNYLRRVGVLIDERSLSRA